MVKVKFDKDGWFIKQIVKIEVKHEDDHDRFYPKVKSVLEYDKSKYSIHDHTTYKNYDEKDLCIVPLYETNYKGKKYKEWNKESSGALAIVNKLIKSGKILIIKILIPK